MEAPHSPENVFLRSRDTPWDARSRQTLFPPPPHKNAKGGTEALDPTLLHRTAFRMETYSCRQLRLRPSPEGTYLWARDFQVFVGADVWLVGCAGWLPFLPALLGDLKPPQPLCGLLFFPSWNKVAEINVRSPSHSQPWSLQLL